MPLDGNVQKEKGWETGVLPDPSGTLHTNTPFSRVVSVILSPDASAQDLGPRQPKQHP